LTKKFGHLYSNREININSDKSEIIGLIGENGSGKSTLMKQIIGFYTIDEGTISINNIDISSDNYKIKNEIGYVSGEVNLPLYLTVKEYFEILISVHKISDIDFLKKLIDDFKIDIYKKIKLLSKGNKQKIMIVAALMHKPKLLIFDEPSSGLDETMRTKLFEWLRYFKQKGALVILSSHILDELESIIDRAIIINKGAVIRDILKSDFKSSINYYLVETNDSISNTFPFTFERKSINKIIVRVSEDEMDLFFDWMIKINAISFSKVNNNLESLVVESYKGEK
jgi:ABC-2 type transport system ATP-binding protein